VGDTIIKCALRAGHPIYMIFNNNFTMQSNDILVPIFN